MGCDVHLHIEHRKDDGTWECVAVDWFDPAEFEERIRDGQTGISAMLQKPRLQDDLVGAVREAKQRNYELFSLLSNVRSYGEKVVPLFEENGVPEDASAWVKENNESWGVDGHTHTHFMASQCVEHLEKIKEVSSEFAEMIKIMAFTFTDLSRVRIVLWYDN